MLPVAHWWTLRERFRQSMPGVVTDNYLATALSTQPMSARTNVLPYLKDMGLIDNEGKTQELAKAWRDDEQYAEVCRKIRKEIYPDELIAAVPNPSIDRSAAERWFANHTGAGSAAVKRMAAIYTVISEGDVSKKLQKERQKERATTRKGTAKADKKKSAPSSTSQAIHPVPSLGDTPALPGVNINLQIHISSDATPDQIDKIFESIAKHIYRK
ncbi:MAG: DUF5343 domain-containing protein [Thermodesulfobacteriota bacterium]